MDRDNGNEVAKSRRLSTVLPSGLFVPLVAFGGVKGAGQESALGALGNEVLVGPRGATASFPLPLGDTDGWVRHPTSVIELVVEVSLYNRRQSPCCL